MEDIINDIQVRVYIYDLAKGLAKLFSQSPLGDKRINGLWHTSVVTFGEEYYFSKNGIDSVKPNGTILGNPLEILKLGTTQYTYNQFEEFISDLGESKYTPDKYHIFDHNCNNFTQEVITYLTGKKIPEYLLILPKEVINTTLGDSLKVLLEPVKLNVETKIAKMGKIKERERRIVIVELPPANIVEKDSLPADTIDDSTTEPLVSTTPDPVEEPVQEEEVTGKIIIEACPNEPEDEDIEDLNIIVTQSKIDPEFWELTESLVAAKRRETSPLVINNIDDSKYPQLLCYFKRSEKEV